MGGWSEIVGLRGGAYFVFGNKRCFANDPINCRYFCLLKSYKPLLQVPLFISNKYFPGSRQYSSGSQSISSGSPSDRFYTKEHEWAMECDENIFPQLSSKKAFMVGITDVAQKSLGDIVFVDFSTLSPGDAIRANGPTFSIFT